MGISSQREKARSPHMKTRIDTQSSMKPFAQRLTAALLARSLALFICALPAAFLPAARVIAAGPALNFYVATNGSDAWTGRLPSPTHHGDGPFATVGAAQRALARRKAGGGLSGPVTVWIRGGTYRLTRPLRFTAADSGSESAPITYEAYTGEKPVFTGDQAIAAHWHSYSGNPQIKVTPIAQVAQGQWNFNLLSINNQPRDRARMPAKGQTYSIVPFDQSHPLPADDPDRRLHFYARPGDINPHWTNLQDIEMSKIARFTNSREKLLSMDPAYSLVTLAAPTIKNITSYGADYGGNDHYFLDNVFEGLAPGAWYLNRHTGDLYYWPRAGEKIGQETFAAPIVSQLLTVEGTPGAFVHHLAFKGLTFIHTSNPMPDAGYPGFVPVYDVPVLPAIEVRNADSISFVRNTVHDVTGAGYRQLNTSNSLISGNLVYRTAGDGIQAGDPAEVPGAPSAVSSASAFAGNIITDNTIHDVGLTYAESPAIIEHHQSHSLIAHNLVYNTPGSGIYLQGGKAADGVGSNRVEYNIIHDAMQQIDDDGGIYMINADPNTKIVGNIIHDIGQYGRWYCAGIYLDVGQTDLTVQGNQVYRAMVGLMLNGGSGEPVKDCIITDNIFADSSWIAIAFQQDNVSRALTGITFERNVISVQNHLEKPLLISGFTPTSRYPFSKPYAFATTAGGATTITQVHSDHNLFYNPDALADWQNGVNVWKNPALMHAPAAIASDAHSLEADPQFVDYAHGNFSLSPSSPLFQFGFQAVNVSAAGPRPVMLDQVKPGKAPAASRSAPRHGHKS